MPKLSKRKSKVPLEWHVQESRWDWFFLVVLTGFLLFLPFSLGVVEPWSELVTVCVAAVLLLALLLRSLLEASFRPSWSWTFLPLAIVITLICWQLVPLPQSLLATLSPSTAELRAELLGSNPDLPPTLSLYAHETRHDLRMALVFSALFITVSNAFRSSHQIRRLLLVVFLVGCLEAAIALLQILTLTDTIHWNWIKVGSVVTSGSFVNHSHFCQFVNLTLGAGVALLLVRMRQDGRRERGRASRLVDLKGGRYLRPLAGIVLCGVAVFTSMSRNGVISLLVASAIVGVLLFRRGVLSVRGWALGMVPWCVALVIFLTCFDMVYDRFATLEEREHLDTRLEMTSSTLRAWRDFPWWGAGLGTHEYVFPLYDVNTMTSMAEHADNDWAQLLEEFGLVGGSAVFAFVLSIFYVGGKAMLSGKSTLSTAVFGLSLGLLATAWHSLSDFGQHLPGIFSVTAVVAGLVVAIAAREAEKTRTQERHRAGSHSMTLRRKTSLAFLTLCVTFACGWAIRGSFASYRATAWQSVALGIEGQLVERQWQGSDEDYTDLLVAAQNAAEAEPGNVKLGHMLNLARWHSISRSRDSASGTILLAEESLPFVERIADELAGLRSLCPVYGPLYGLEGELRLFVLEQPEGADLIKQAAKLVPFDPQVNLLAGQLAVQQEESEEAIQYLNRAVALSPGYFRAVAGIYVLEMQHLQAAIDLTEGDLRRTKHLAELLRSSDEEERVLELIEQLEASALAQLRELVASGEASAREAAELASIEERDNNPQAAIELYRRALALDYGQVNWRLTLAKLLIAEGKPREAIREARICLRLRPELEAARQIIADLSSYSTEPPPANQDDFE